MKRLKLKLNVDFGPMGTKDREITVDCDNDGIPLDKFWRDRLKDSEIDGCVEVVLNKPQSRAKRTTED